MKYLHKASEKLMYDVYSLTLRKKRIVAIEMLPFLKVLIMVSANSENIVFILCNYRSLQIFTGFASFILVNGNFESFGVANSIGVITELNTEIMTLY